jgi:hypothetical protein
MAYDIGEPWQRHHLGVWPRRRTAVSLADVVELLTGIGRLLQRMDGRLEEVVELLKDEDDGPEERS